jgi:hypothetical protein
LNSDTKGHGLVGAGVLHQFTQTEHSFVPSGGIILKRETLVIANGLTFWVEKVKKIVGHVRLSWIRAGARTEFWNLVRMSLKGQR